MTEPSGRFSVDAMTRTMRKIAAHLGISADDARLLRLTNNAVFALPAAALVVRITRSHELLDRADKVAALGIWFADVDASTIRLADVQQPIHVDGLAATVWRYLPPVDGHLSVEDLGNTIHDFHHLGVPPFTLPRWDPVGDARRRLRDAEALTGETRDVLEDWCDRLTPRIDDLLGLQPTGLIHGDAHVGNLLRDETGRVVLCDFDATCLGPWQVDLVAVAVGDLRFGRTGAHRQLAAAYGYDITTDPMWALLREARELKMIAAATPLLASTPGIASEFNLRLRSALNHNDAARWTPYADLAVGGGSVKASSA